MNLARNREMENEERDKRKNRRFGFTIDEVGLTIGSLKKNGDVTFS